MTSSGRNTGQVNYKKYFVESDEEEDEDMDEENEHLGMSHRERRAAKRQQAKWDQQQETDSEAEDDEEGEEDAEESEGTPSHDEEVKASEKSFPTRRGRGRPPKAETKTSGRRQQEAKTNHMTHREKVFFAPVVSRSQRAAARN